MLSSIGEFTGQDRIDNNIIHFPTVEKLKADGSADRRYGAKNKVGFRTSTKMECLYNREEILSIFNIFDTRVKTANTISKEFNSRRNLTMFVSSINLGLRGGDFCCLKWSNIFNEDWTFKNGTDYIPEKTIRRDENDNIIRVKHIELLWNHDFEVVILEWLNWLNDKIAPQSIDGFIFASQKGGHIGAKRWWEIMEKTRKSAGIKQKIGTHGLRKTMAHHYVMNAIDKNEALMQLSILFGHSDVRTTQRYACLEKQDIIENKERMSFIYDA